MVRPSSRELTKIETSRRTRRHRESVRRPIFHPSFDNLEVRITPTTDVWSGAVDNLWSRGANWQGGVAPVAGDDLVFPAGVAQKTAANNFADGTTFGSITIADSGYDLIGNAIHLTGGLSASYTSLISMDEINTTFSSGAAAVSVSAGGELDIFGSVSGTGGMTLAGGGVLKLTGISANTYTGTTTVNAGTLLLNKTGVAVPGDLVIGDGAGSDLVRLLAADQIGDSATVTVNSSGTFNLNGFNDTIGTLVLTGSSVATGTGALTLNGDLTTNSSATQATFTGKLALAAGSHTFNIADPVPATLPDLVISADISGATGFTKTGLGNLKLSGTNTFTGVTDIQSGIVTITNASGLGTSAGGTTIASGAELDLLNGFTLSEPLSMAGTGINGSVLGLDINSYVLTGNVTLTGNIALGMFQPTQLTFSGKIDDGASSYGITKNGPGTLILNGGNTYDGGTTVNAGTVKTNNAGALGTGTVTAPSGTSLVILNTGTMTNDLVIGGNALTVDNAGSLTLPGNIVLTSNTNVNPRNDTRINFSGAISGSFALDIASGTALNAGGITFSGSAANTYTGTTTVHTGTITLSKSGGAVAIPGDLVLADGPTGFPITATETAADQIADSAAVSLTAGSTLNLNGFNDAIGSLTLTGSSVQTGAGTLTLTANLTTTDAGIGASSITGTVVLPATAVITVADGSQSIDFDINGTVSGAGTSLTKAGPGTLQLSGTNANTFTGAATVSAGTLSLNKTAGQAALGGSLAIAGGASVSLANDDQLSDSGVVTMGSGSTLNFNNHNDTIGGLNLTGSKVATGTGTLTLGGDVTTNSAAVTSVISGNLDLGGATRAFTIADNAQLDPDLSITANISGTGAGLTKLGANSQFKLSGNNSYDGTTTVAAGAIEIASDNALGISSAGTVVNSGFSVALLGGITVAEPFTINGAGFGGLGAIFNGNGDNTISGAITLGAAGTLGSLSGNLTFSGAISDGAGSFALTKVYSGTVTLAGANTYDGGTTISGGVVAISNGSALGTGSVSISNGSELDLSNDITLSRNIAFRGTGMNGNGALRSVSGNNVYSGAATLQANATQIQVDAGRLTLSGNLDDGGNHYGTDKTGAGLLLVSGNLTSSGLLSSVAGEVSVTGAYAGAVTLAGGNISGTGTVGGINQAVGAVGFVDPGTTRGTTGALSTSGGYGISTGITTHIDLGGTTAGSTYDQVVNTPAGSVILTDSNLEVSLVTSFVPAVGDTFRIIDNQSSGAVVGTFHNLAEGATFKSGIVTYQVSYLGGTGNDVTLTAIAITYSWTGAGADNHWSTAANWDAGTAPTNGSDLVFPSGAARLTENNDLSGLSLHSVSIQGSGYLVTGNAISISNGFSASYPSGTSEIALNTTLTANESTDVASGGTFILSGAVSGGSSILTKIGGGTLEFSGTTNNTFGQVDVNAGTLLLGKTGGGFALNSTLVIGDHSGTSATVRFVGNDEVVPAAGIQVNEGATLDVNATSQHVASLTLQGGTVSLPAGSILYVNSSITNHVAVDHSASMIQGLGTLDLAGTVSFPIAVAHDNTLNADLTISSTIQNGGIVKSGTGTLALSGTNTYPGNTFVNVGVVVVESNAGLGASGSGTTFVASGASLYLSGTNLNIPQDVQLFGPGGLALAAVSGSATLAGKVTLMADSAIGAAPDSTLTLNGVIDDFSHHFNITVINGANGRVVLGGANTFGGVVTVTAGYLQLANDNAFGDPTAVVTEVFQSGASLDLSGGITIPATKSINLDGGSAGTSSKIDNLSGNNIILGPISLTNATQSIDVASGTVLTIGGNISGSVNLNKNDTGTLDLTGTSSMTGQVNVAAGMLTVDGSIASNSLVSVDGTLGGIGTVPAVSISSTGTLASGNPIGASVGGLSTGNLSLTTGSTYSAFILGPTASTQYGQTNVTGTVDLTGATLNVSLGYPPSTGTVFTIINNDGSDPVTGTFNGLPEGSTFTVGNQPFVVSYVGGTGNDVTLTALVRIDTWTGLGGNPIWSTGANWASGIAPASSDQLVFPVGASRTTNANDLTAGTHFDSIIIGGAGYDIIGNGIALDHGITTHYSSGTSTFALDTALTANETIDVASGGTLTVPGVISGGFALTKASAGTLALAGANTYTGGTTINAGIVAASHSQAFGTGNVADLAEIDFSNVLVVANNFTVNSAGTAFVVNGPITLTGTVNLVSNTAINTTNLNSLSLNGVVSGSGGLITNGTGTVGLSQSNTYLGGTTVNGGILQVNNSQSTGTAGTVTINGGASLAVSTLNYVLPAGGLTLAASSTVLNPLPQYNAMSGAITLTGDTTFDIAAGGWLVVNGGIGGAFGLTKASGGALWLQSDGTYTGPTTVMSGPLYVEGDIASSSGVTVDAQADLAGNGVVGNVTVNGGTLYPGDNPGILSAGTVTFSNSSIFLENAHGSTVGNGYNQLVASGAVNLGGASLVAAFSYAATNGDQLTIVKNNSGLPVVGTFAGLPEGALVTDQGHPFSISYVGGMSHQDVVLTYVQPTTTYVSSDKAVASYGDPLIFTALVTAGSGIPTGTVFFYDGPVGPGTLIGTATLNNLGIAAITTSALPASGTPYTITAMYQGRTLYAGSTSGGYSQTVNQAVLNVTADAQSRAYGSANPSLTYTINGFVNGQTLATSDVTGSASLSTTATPASHVSGSPYTITASTGSLASGNYSFNFVNGQLSVTPVALTITANNQTKGYGAALPTLTASYTGFVNGDTPVSLTTPATLSTTATASSHVSGSPYAITASGAVDTDYAISYGPGALVVIPAPLTVTANNQTKAYGAALPTLTASFTGFVNGDSPASLTTPPTLSTTATASSHVSGSPYAISASGAVDTDYTISYVSGALAVTPVALTITADDQTKGYGAALPTLTASYTGFVNGDTTASLTTPPTVTTNATASSHVSGSPYAITASGAVDTDYSIRYVPGALAVTPVALTITADNQTKGYGAALPTLTASYTGFANGDTPASLTTSPTLSTTAAASSHVSGSPYAITASGAVDTDYAISYGPGALVVIPAPLTVTANNQTKAYGAALPTLTASYTGFVNGDTSASLTTLPALSTTATAASHVSGSPYAINASGAVDTDYAISYVTGAVAVTPVALTVTSDDQTKGYGAALPTLTASYTGFVNGDSSASLTTLPTVSTTATSASHVAGNPYAVTASGAVDLDYTIGYIAGQLAVTPVALTVTANNQLKVYGAALPALTAGYSGFVNGDTSASLTTLPTLTTTATPTSPIAGNPYPITASGAVDPDYTMSYAGGQLTVGQASTSVALASSSPSSTYGQPVTFTATLSVVTPGAGTPTGTVTFTDGDTFLGTVPLSGNVATWAISALAPAPHGITATYNGDVSFAGSPRATMVQTINRATPAAVLSLSTVTPTSGQPVTFTATITPTPATVLSPIGLVYFFSDQVQIGEAWVVNGQATITTTLTASVGTTHRVYAVYGGDPDFVAAATNQINLTVSPVVSLATTTSLVGVATSSPSAGANLVTNVTSVSPANGVPTGTVTYYYNGAKWVTLGLANGAAFKFVSNANLAGKSFVVKYSGDATHNASTSPAVVYGRNGFHAASRPITAFARRGHGQSSNSRQR